jgi:predicted Zn finger-like uncharacterized protein
MKIVCDSCSTKYSISDDKVRGKVFKIRCKKCSHIIVVKGNTEAAPAAAEGPVDAVWHLVVDGDQVGPLTDADVRARVARNEITAENYVWKEGFADWLRLADVPEFSDLAGTVAPSTSIGGELFSDSGSASLADPSSAGGFFGGLGGGHDVGHASGQSGRNHLPVGGDEDAFAAAAAPASEGADLFGVAPVVARADSGRIRGRNANGTGPVGRHDGGRVENLTAQRSENSVLFSLSNLQSLAAPAAVARPASAPATTEGSGLIDIRAMAASTLKAPAGGGSPLFGGGSRAGEDDLPAFGAFSSAAPVLLSMPSQSGPPKWIYALIVLAGLLLIAVGVAFFTILGKPVIVEAPPPPPAPVAAPAPTPAGKPAEDKAAGAKPIAEGELPPREGEAAAAGDKGGEKPGEKKIVGPIAKRGVKGGRKVGGGAGAAVAAGGGDAKGAAATPAEPDKVKPAKGSLDDLIEGALKRPGATSGSGAKPKVDDDSGKKAEGGGPLQKAAVVAGMNGIKGKISACYQQYKQSGMAMVNVVIAKSGKVSSATVTGKFAGTPTGSCVEAAVKSASFPPSDGLSTPYPFTLR